jgi:hypothetical protein
VTKNLVAALALLMAASEAGGQGNGLRFMGRKVTVTAAKKDSEGAASLCLEGPPERTCYKTDKPYGYVLATKVVQVKPGMQALFFVTESRGTSGSSIRFALLRLQEAKLTDIFNSDTEVSNQSQYAFWSEPTLSEAQLFVTADFVWGPDESHYEPHRYTISVFALRAAPHLLEDKYYYLEDRYMTVQKYDRDEAQDDILKSERPEILARLKRVRAVWPPK